MTSFLCYFISTVRFINLLNRDRLLLEVPVFYIWQLWVQVWSNHRTYLFHFKILFHINMNQKFSTLAADTLCLFAQSIWMTFLTFGCIHWLHVKFWALNNCYPKTRQKSVFSLCCVEACLINQVSTLDIPFRLSPILSVSMEKAL